MLSTEWTKACLKKFRITKWVPYGLMLLRQKALLIAIDPSNFNFLSSQKQVKQLFWKYDVCTLFLSSSASWERTWRRRKKKWLLSKDVWKPDKTWRESRKQKTASSSISILLILSTLRISLLPVIMTVTKIWLSSMSQARFEFWNLGFNYRVSILCSFFFLENLIESLWTGSL